MKVTVEMRDEVLQGYLGQWFANATKSTGSSINSKDERLSFQARNRHNFWKTVHPRKGSGGAWIPFQGPQSLQGKCDARWIEEQIRLGGFYPVTRHIGNNTFTDWKWDAEIVFRDKIAV